MSLYPGFGLPAIPTAPPGLEAIYGACKRAYPDQSNPLQVTALVKVGGGIIVRWRSIWRLDVYAS